MVQIIHFTAFFCQPKIESFDFLEFRMVLPSVSGFACKTRCESAIIRGRKVPGRKEKERGAGVEQEEDISLGAEQAFECGGGWSAARYHCDGGESVASFLSFKSVFEVNPFEIGANHAAERRMWSVRRRPILTALDVWPLLRRPFDSLSNGETRRVLLARALLKAKGRLAVADAAGGLDPQWRERLPGLARVAAGFGVELVAGAERGPAPARRSAAARRQAATPPRPPAAQAKPLVEMEDVSLSFGRKSLFRGLSWTVREGERWLLRGPNGSGKTTLFAIVSGDSPLGYAFGVKLFGRRLGCGGIPLAEARRRIGVVSVEREMRDGVPVAAQLDAALSRGVKLLLLDEPCCNLPPGAADGLLDRVSDWLDAHPAAAAVCVAHVPAHVPRGFSLELRLGS